MPKVTEYKCPCCGGALEFNSSSQNITCPYCESEFSAADLEAYDEELKNDIEENLEWKQTGGQEWEDGEEGSMVTYHCSSCGGDIYTDENTAATSCPYCGSPVILNGRLAGSLKPDYVIPFAKTPEDATASLKRHFKGKILLHPSFKKQVKVEEIKGLYVPFWLFDASASGRVSWHATKERRWSDSNYNYHETRHFSVVRGGGISFEHIPVDGSKVMDDKYMESIEPYDFAGAKDFQGVYLAGYLADKYDVDQEASRPRANQRVKDGTVNAFRSTISSNYSTLELSNVKINLHDTDCHYALYPVHTLVAKWREKPFLFCVNGQTGKIAGDLPVSWGLFFLWLFGVGILSGVLLSLIFYASTAEENSQGDPLSFVIGGAIGLAIGIIVALILKKQLKSVKFVNGAGNYVVPGSMNITESRDTFLYRTVRKTRREKKN